MSYFRNAQVACPRVFLGLLLAFVLCLSSLSVPAQDKKQTKVNEDEIVRINSNLVSMDVMVKDRKGKAITDLKAEDFTVTENGVRQKIEFFDSTLSGNSEPGQPLTTTTETVPKPPTGFPRNIIALVLDGQSTESANLKHVREGMTKYIREHVSDSDSVALFAISGGLQLLQPFTQDKARLVSAVDKAYTSSTVSKTFEARELTQNIESIRDQLSGAPDPAEPIAATPGAAATGSGAAQAMIARRVLEQYIALRSALSAQQTRPVLAALAAICEGLRPIPGKKTLVMFSQGFVAPQALDWQVQSTIDIANRANVAIYIIDSGGLTGGAPQSGALVPGSPLLAISAATSQENRIRAAAGESVFDVSRHEGLDRQQDLLYRISGDTGGQFIKNTNDIAQALNRVDQEIRSRYTLAYRSTDSNFDGSFRKVKIEVARSDAVVAARSGYNAIPPNQIVPSPFTDRKMMADFVATAAHPTLPLSVQLTSFRSQPGFYTVPMSFELSPEAVQFERQGDMRRLQLEVMGVVRTDNENGVVAWLGGNFDIMLTAQQYEQILNEKIYYRQDMQLEAGTYTIELLVKDRRSGKAAAKRETLVFPVAGTEFSASDLVLSRHAQPAKQPYLASADVLAEGNVLIRPSLSKEFRATDNLIIFFHIYNYAPAPETGKPNVRVTVSLMKDGKPVIKPLDYELSNIVVEPVPHLTFAKYVKLAGLSPGKYSVAIESRDVVQKKTIKQEGAFTIVQ